MKKLILNFQRISFIDPDFFALIIFISALSLLYFPVFLLLPLEITFILSTLLFLLWLIFTYFQFHLLKKIIGSLLLIIICMGYFHHQALDLYRLSSEIKLLPKKVNVEFQIIDILHQGNYQTAIIKTVLPNEKEYRRIYINWQQKERLNLGEVWRGELRLRAVSSRLNFGGFDRQKWLLAKGISAYANVKSAVKITQNLDWRQKRLQQALIQTKPLSAQGLLIALGFGERAWLKSDTWLVYQQTNTAHLIAISGLHISLAMLIGFWLARLFQFSLPTKWITPNFPLVIGALVAWIYAALAGFSIPTFRAIIALLVLIIFRLCRAYCTPWRALIRVIALLVIFDPFMLLSVSFWLSVGAVSCLILWYQLVPLRLIQWQGKSLEQSPLKYLRYILGLFHLQLGLFLLFTPLQLYFFHGFSITGLTANLISVPFFSLILIPLILFAVFTNGSFSSWYWANQLAEWITQSISWQSGNWVDISTKNSVIITALLALLYLMYLYWLYLQHQIKSKKSSLLLRKPSGLNFNREVLPSLLIIRNSMKASWILIIGCVIFYCDSLFSQPKWKLETLDVGQGLATLIVKNNRAILYDTGAAWRNGSMAELEIIPYLQRQGIQLDWLILSHDDNDHSGGAKAILKAYPNVNLMMPSWQNYGKTDRMFCQKGSQLKWQGLTFSVLSPPRPVQRANNPDSCILLVNDGINRVLLTGDADVGTENQILAELDQIDVLQVGHHGSKTSTSERFVNKIKPKIALISSGRWNAWGFPHHLVTERLTKVESDIYNTALLGQISLHFDNNIIKIYTARDDFSPWYQGIIGL